MPWGRGHFIVAAVAAGIGMGALASHAPEAEKRPVQASAPPAPAIKRDRLAVQLSSDEARANAGPVHTLLNVEKRMQYGEFIWNDRGVPKGPVWVRVDLDRQIVSVFRAGHEIGTAVILYGADSNETPIGTFPVLAKIRDHHSSTYDAPMPYTLRLTGDGVAIHGSEVQWGRATHGCIGVPLEFAKRVFGQVQAGDEVAIIG